MGIPRYGLNTDDTRDTVYGHKRDFVCVDCLKRASRGMSIYGLNIDVFRLDSKARWGLGAARLS